MHTLLPVGWYTLEIERAKKENPFFLFLMFPLSLCENNSFVRDIEIIWLSEFLNLRYQTTMYFLSSPLLDWIREYSFPIGKSIEKKNWEKVGGFRDQEKREKLETCVQFENRAESVKPWHRCCQRDVGQTGDFADSFFFLLWFYSWENHFSKILFCLYSFVLLVRICISMHEIGETARLQVCVPTVIKCWSRSKYWRHVTSNPIKRERDLKFEATFAWIKTTVCIFVCHTACSSFFNVFAITFPFLL